MNGALSVNGTVSMATGTLDLNGALTVGASGSLALGGATHTVASDLTVSGGLTASGTLVFDGGTSATSRATAPLPNVQISKTRGATLVLVQAT